MHTTGRDVEPDAGVSVDALLEIGDADHDMVDARKNSVFLLYIRSVGCEA